MRENESRPLMRQDGPLFSGTVPRLYQRVFEILAEQIGAGSIATGTCLRESTVAAQFGISRAPARQALVELERTGLVKKAAGRGYTVRALANRKPLQGDAGGWVPTDMDLRLSSAASWERIYAEVEREIVARTSFAGWRVNEAVLARHYHVSRTVARDVVGRLQQRGVIQKDDRGRWYAPGLTAEHIGELYELRRLLEPVALVKAAPNLPPDLIPRMRANLENALAQAHEIGGSTLDQLEEEMHVELLGHCGNRTLMQAITLPQSLLIAHRFLYRWTPRLFETEPFLPEHMEVIGHLEAGRIAKAARALQNHLRVSRERAIARVDVVSRQFEPDDLPYLERLAYRNDTPSTS